ncbi:uncharacterized protein LOC111387570 [Olea europaea var. sylvestris]|uniref:uncharacterized protein LOC111387570 n=1 Tax=Olea europaea var. sylvestris TaxID=158386 RepID=UPI000C1CD8A3|nr:uncharacterized protein LOC111387570 [Olea europaea var. sylvestris]
MGTSRVEDLDVRRRTRHCRGHRHGKCFSSTGWERLRELFNKNAGKNWTMAQLKTIRENPRYGKFKDNDNTEIYHKYSRLFGDDPNDTLPINAETTNSSNDPTLGKASFSMNISLRRSGEKLKGKHAKGKWKKFRAREVSESVDNLAYASREMASVIRAKEDGRMTLHE